MMVRIGNGSGFWGDSQDAPVELAASGHLDYLTLEYLAELTMSILAVQKGRDPTAGYATDFLSVLEIAAEADLIEFGAHPQVVGLVSGCGGDNMRVPF